LRTNNWSIVLCFIKIYKYISGCTTRVFKNILYYGLYNPQCIYKFFCIAVRTTRNVKSAEKIIVGCTIRFCFGLFRLGLVRSDLVCLASVWSGSIRLGLVQFRLVRLDRVRSGLVWFGSVWSGFVLSGSVWCSLVWSG